VPALLPGVPDGEALRKLLWAPLDEGDSSVIEVMYAFEVGCR